MTGRWEASNTAVQEARGQLLLLLPGGAGLLDQHRLPLRVPAPRRRLGRHPLHPQVRWSALSISIDTSINISISISNNTSTSSCTSREGLGYCQAGPATELERMDGMVLLDLLGAPRPSFRRYTRCTTCPCTRCTRYNTSLYDLAGRAEEELRRRGWLQGTTFFTNQDSSQTIQDDQVPFLRLGVSRILHMIDSPFPSVWHQLADDRWEEGEATLPSSALDLPTIHGLARVLRVLLYTYLK